MRRALALFSLLLVSSALLGASLSFTADPLIDVQYAQTVQDALTELLVDRLQSPVHLTAFLASDYTLRIEGDEADLTALLVQQKKEVRAFLYDLLGWDAVRFFGPLEGAHLSYPIKAGFMLAGLEGAKEGQRYWVLDAEGTAKGSVTLIHSVEHSQLAVQRSGRTLLPHMALRQASTFDIGLYTNLSLSLGWGAEVFVHHHRSLHPLFISASIAYHSVDGMGVGFGLGATFALSQLFSNRSHLWRNLSIEGWAGAHLGFSDTLLYGADGRIGLSYHLGQWKITALAGNRISIRDNVIVDQGLFFTLGTAYTMSR